MAAKKRGSKRVVGLAGKGRLARVSVSRIEWIQAMEDEKRSTAILQPIGLDLMLKVIILNNFRQRAEDVDKLMKSMNMIQKARLAHILGLISKTVLNDLEQLHEIRNKFAHSFEASFASTKVLGFVRNLSTAKGGVITKKNSYEFYSTALGKCLARLVHCMNTMSKDKKGQ